MGDAFNARFVSTFSPDRLYRVYIDRGEMFFIRIGGQGGVGKAVASQLGLLGILLMRVFSKKAERKLAERIAALDAQHPSAHLAGHKHNFHSSTSAVERSSLEPAPLIGGHGEHFGRWKLNLHDGKEMLLQLETLDDMKKAYETLRVLGSTHSCNVVWDARKQKYIKAATAQGAAGGSLKT